MEVPRITVNELKAMMDKGEDVTIIDARQSGAYASSNKKIKGAAYLDPDNDAAIRTFAKGLEKDRALVIYCA